jgi:cysteine synthase
MDVLSAIGNPPLVELKNILPPDSSRLLAKLEWVNPTGNMKDRMAYAAIQAAERSGRLQPGATVVKYPRGTIGLPANAISQDGMCIVFAVDDVDAACQELEQKGVQLVEGPADHPDWLARTVPFRDPQGNLVELSQSLSA